MIHNARLRDHLNSYRGREIKTTGDGLLAVFDRPIRAAQCAEAMATTSRAMELPIRVGIHTGEVEFVGDDARGLAVHTAARIMSLGGADEVMVSSTTRELLEGWHQPRGCRRTRTEGAAGCAAGFSARALTGLVSRPGQKARSLTP